MSAAEELSPPVSYTIEPRDLAAVRARQFRKIREDAGWTGSLVAIAGAGAGGLAMAITVAHLVNSDETGTLASSAIVGFGAGVLFQTMLAQWTNGRALARLDRRVLASAAGGDATATLDHEALTIASDAGVGTRCAYGAIGAVERDGDGLFVFIGDDLILHVPRRAFPDESALRRWVEAIERRKAGSRG